MLSEFFINSVVANLELLEKQSLKLNLNVTKQENISKQENILIKQKLDKNLDLFSNFLNEKINDSDIVSFVNSKESKSLLSKLNDINSLLNNNIKIKQEFVQKSDNETKVYNFMANKLIKDKLKSLNLEYSLKDKDLFKENKVESLVALLKVNDNGILNKDKILSNMEKYKDKENTYTNNEVKVMSEMSKYLISSLNDDMEAMEAIQVSGRFTSTSEAEILQKSGYAEGYGQYLRGTGSLGVAQSTAISSSYYSNIRAQSCHSNCHSNCHGARGWR